MDRELSQNPRNPESSFRDLFKDPLFSRAESGGGGGGGRGGGLDPNTDLPNSTLAFARSARIAVPFTTPGRAHARDCKSASAIDRGYARYA